MEDKKEMLILSSLRQNSRASLTEMSKDLRIPVSTIYDKLKIFSGKQVKKYTSILDFHNLGYGAKAIILIKSHRDRTEALKTYLMNHKAVNTLMKVNNGYNFLAEIIFKDMPEMENFLDRLESDFDVTEKQAFYIIDDIKREDFLNSPEYIKLIGV